MVRSKSRRDLGTKFQKTGFFRSLTRKATRRAIRITTRMACKGIPKITGFLTTRFSSFWTTISEGLTSSSCVTEYYTVIPAQYYNVSIKLVGRGVKTGSLDQRSKVEIIRDTSAIEEACKRIQFSPRFRVGDFYLGDYFGLTLALESEDTSGAEVLNNTLLELGVAPISMEWKLDLAIRKKRLGEKDWDLFFDQSKKVFEDASQFNPPSVLQFEPFELYYHRY